MGAKMVVRDGLLAEFGPAGRPSGVSTGPGTYPNWNDHYYMLSGPGGAAGSITQGANQAICVKPPQDDQLINGTPLPFSSCS